MEYLFLLIQFFLAKQTLFQFSFDDKLERFAILVSDHHQFAFIWLQQQAGEEEDDIVRGP